MRQRSSSAAHLLAGGVTALLLSACACDPQAGGGHGELEADAGTPGADRSDGGARCEPCGDGRVCDEATGRCVGGCAPGTGTCAAGCCAWRTETIDVVPAMTGGYRPEIAIDKLGTLHILHRGYRYQPQVMLVTREAGAWTPKAAYSAANSDWQNALVLDGAGGLWLGFGVFNQDNSKDFVVGHLAPGAEPEYQEVGKADFGTPATLAVDRAGALHAGWVHWSPDNEVTIGTFAGGSWTTGKVAVPFQPSWTMDLRLDPQDRPHLAFGAAAENGGGVFYGTDQGAGWTFEKVAGAVSTSRVSLAIDASGTPHLAFSQTADERLYYGRRVGGAWRIEPVTAAGWNPSIALDPAGRAHLACYHRGEQSLLYARRVGEEAWDVQVVDPGPAVGHFSGIALDAEGQPHLAYSDTGKHKLKYATLPR